MTDSDRLVVDPKQRKLTRERLFMKVAQVHGGERRGLPCRYMCRAEVICEQVEIVEMAYHDGVNLRRWSPVCVV